MKIRTGFVSNSSSSSFCVYGCYLDENKYYEVIKDKKNYKILENNNITDHGAPGDWCGTMIGRSLTTIKNNETGKEFREKTEINMKRVFGKDIKLNIYEEGWYDG